MRMNSFLDELVEQSIKETTEMPSTLEVIMALADEEDEDEEV